MLKPDAPMPLYRQLADLLADSIRSGRYPPGSRIPSEPRLAAAHDLGRPTVRQAIELLVRRGLLTRRRGAGTFVCDPQQEVDLFSLDGTSASFAKSGLAVETRILEPVVRRRIDDQPDNPFHTHEAYTFSRLTRVATTPVLVETLFLHAGLFEGIDAIDLDGQSLSTIADERFYLRPVGGKQNFRIAFPDSGLSGHLGMTTAAPVLEVHRWLHFSRVHNGVFARLWCRTDHFVFSQTLGGA